MALVRKESMPSILKKILARLMKMESSLLGSGATRPTSPSVGQMFFDANLGHPVWWDGTDWVDGSGNIV